MKSLLTKSKLQSLKSIDLDSYEYCVYDNYKRVKVEIKETGLKLKSKKLELVLY